MWQLQPGLLSRAAIDAGAGGAPAGAPLDAVASVTGAWLLSRDLLTSFAGGTRYTKTGTAIMTLEDQSGNNRDFHDAATANYRPTEATAFPASVLCADFNGVLNNLRNVAISNFFTASSGAAVISVIIDAVTINDGTVYNNHGILNDTGQYLGLYARNLSGVTFSSFNYPGSTTATSGTGTVGTAYVLMWRHHGGNLYLSINGAAETSVASGNTGNLTGLFVMGMGGSGTGLCNMKVAEVFTTSDGSQTSALATAITSMKTHVGI